MDEAKKMLDDVDIIILLNDNKSFKTSKKSYKLKIFGKSMIDYVRMAVEGADVIEVEASRDDDVLSLVKPHLTDKKYTVVLYADTPLLKRKTLLDVLEYVTIKRLSAVKLTRGYVFENSYLKDVEKIYNPQPAYFDEEDFIAAYNLKQLAMIGDIMKNRILSFHMKNGVRILDTANTYIDAEVNIESEVVIYPNNYIYGKSYIEKGVKLRENNVIKDSYILEKAEVTASHIHKSVVGKKCGVGPFAYLHGESVMEEKSQVGAFVELKKGKLEKEAKVKRLSFIGKE
jgi:bifunctional N-acetylglucosamine-1-phosphate-uridyltransferase/glucosamine-1-phosphate-acetyltransferase GlmU-like protein